MRKTLFLIFCLKVLISCQEKKKDLYSSEIICDCYTQTEFVGIDKTLNSCLTDFNIAINQKKKESQQDNKNFERDYLMELSEKLIKTCPDYQKDFNNMLLNRYSKRNRENLIKRKDSLLKIIDSVDNKAGRYVQLSELEILSGDFEQATKSVNTSIEMNPKMEISYFVRGFLYHRKGDITNAISDVKTMRDITQQADLKSVADLWISNLEQESK